MIPHALIAAAALPAALALSTSPAGAQRDRDTLLDRCRDHRSSDMRLHEVRESGFRSTGSVRVDAGQNGGVHVTTWDRDSVHVHACLYARAWDDAEAREIARDVQIETSRGQVRARSDAMRRDRDWVVTFIVVVPQRTDLSLTAHNGPLTVSGVTGTIELDTRNGPLSLHDVSGDVRGRTRNGPVTVTLTGSRWEGRGLDVETTNGPVTLYVPDGYSARLVTGTSNGPMRANVPMTVTEWNGRRIETELGRGGATVRVVTSNGPANIQRGGSR